MKQAERAELTRQKIIRAAMKEFGANGYRGGTIGNICKTGINKGLIYHYFSSKDDLYLECVKISCGKLVGQLEDAKIFGPDKESSLSGDNRENSAENDITSSFGDKKNSSRSEDESSEVAEEVVRRYMKIRMDYYESCPDEARILFECLLDTPEPLVGQIREIMSPLWDHNLEICGELLSKLKLRNGMTEEKAERYFIFFQYMFNAYFSSPSMREKSLDERIALHERNIPEILDCMLYGIADRVPEEEKGRQK